MEINMVTMGKCFYSSAVIQNTAFVWRMTHWPRGIFLFTAYLPDTCMFPMAIKYLGHLFVFIRIHHSVCSGIPNSQQHTAFAAVWRWPTWQHAVGASCPWWSNTRFRLKAATFSHAQRLKVNCLFLSRSVVALYLHQRWWRVGDILRTSSESRSGLMPVTNESSYLTLIHSYAYSYWRKTPVCNYSCCDCSS